MIKIEVDDRSIQKLLKKLKHRLNDMSPVMEEIGNIILDSVEENFEEGGRYSSPGSWRGGSKKWEPLSPSTIKQRRKEGSWPGQILVRNSAGLAASISVNAGREYVEVGTNKPYAAIHQFGGVIPERIIKPQRAKALKIPVEKGYIFRKKTKIPEVRIPARPFLVIQDEDIEEIREAILEYLTEEV